MTVNSVTPVIMYGENGGTKNWAVPFRFLAAADLEVTRIDADGNVTPLSLGAHYTVTGADNINGGVLSTVTAAAAGVTLRIARATPRIQPMDYTQGDNFAAESHERALDRAIMIAQETAAFADETSLRSLRVPESETIAALPPATSRANKWLTFGAAGAALLMSASQVAAAIVADLTPLLPGNLVGTPGANVMAVGPFTAIPTMDIPTGTNRIRTASHDVTSNLGGADYIEDTTLDDADVAANPLWMTKSNNGRYFKLDHLQWKRAEMFGAKADWDGATGTDNHAAALAAIALESSAPISAFYQMGSLIEWGLGTYWFSTEIDLRKIVHFFGHCTGQDDSNHGTRFIFAAGNHGFVVNRVNTDSAGTVATTTAADGATIEGIAVTVLGSDPTKHAFWLRARANLINNIVDGCPGDAFHIEATSGAGGLAEGNANDWFMSKCHAKLCGGHGLYVSGSDANAGTCIHFVTKICGGCGIYDRSGLGSNTYITPQISGYSANGNGKVSHAGIHYVLTDETAGIGASTTPGTNSNIWYPVGAGATWPAWSAAATYKVELPIFIYGFSNRSVVITPYVEGSMPSHVLGTSIVVGGQSRWTKTTRHLTGVTTGAPGALLSNSGAGGYRSYDATEAAYSVLGTHFFAGVGSGDGVILEHRAAIDGDISYQMAYQANGVITYRFGSAKVLWDITTPTTTRTFGQSAAVPHIFSAHKLGLVNPSNTTESRIMGIASATAGYGNVAAGDRIWMLNAAAGGFAENYCTVGGVVGSTATLKTCNPVSA